MADNVQITAGSGTIISTDDVGGVQFQRVKLDLGANGASVPVEGSLPVSGTVSVDNFPATQAVSAASLPLPTGAATETTLAALNAKIPAAGQTTMANSQPVAIASNQTPIPTLESATILTGAAAQTATVNNILESPSSANGTSTDNVRTASVQVVSTGTGGTFIFEQSNDNVNWIALPVFNAALVTGVPITAAITATASAIVYTFPVRCRFIRLRIATTITGGNIQAFARLSTDPWTPAAQLVASNTAANLLATVSGTVTSNIGTGTLAAVTSANLGVPSIIADVASAALTTTTTTAAFTPTFGTTYIVPIPVTAVTGTNPTLDIGVEESDDNGTNWYRVYDFPRITATGMYRSPPLTLRGNRVRYVQTVGGTTPSFTRAINRLQRSDDAPLRVSFIDRTIVPNTLNSVTPSYYIEGCADFNFMVRCTAQTAAATLTVQFSHDGTNWHTTTNTLTTVNGIAHVKVQNEQWKFGRLNVTAAGTGVVLAEAMIVGRA